MAISSSNKGEESGNQNSQQTKTLSLKDKSSTISEMGHSCLKILALLLIDDVM